MKRRMKQNSKGLNSNFYETASANLFRLAGWSKKFKFECVLLENVNSLDVILTWKAWNTFNKLKQIVGTRHRPSSSDMPLWQIFAIFLRPQLNSHRTATRAEINFNFHANNGQQGPAIKSGAWPCAPSNALNSREIWIVNCLFFF